MKPSRIVFAAARRQHRINEFGIKLLPEKLRSALFSTPETVIDGDLLRRAREDLEKFSLGSQQQQNEQGLHVELPPLHGGNVETHFWNIGQEQVEPYLQLISQMLHQPDAEKQNLPQKPLSWSFSPGWTRYEGSKSTSVAAPLEDCFCFDVEVCVLDGPHPVMATALTNKAWYSWCSPHLVNASRPTTLTIEDLIPLVLDANVPRLIIGHNVSYDRARCSDEYHCEKNRAKFLDTMSLHIVASGMSSEQRMMRQKKSDEEEGPSHNPKWYGETSLNNLNDVYQLYCKGQPPLQKAKRDTFVFGTLEEIREDFQNLMTYCADDVSATTRLVREVFPLYRERCPHPVTLAGMLEMGKCFLPISKRWDQYTRQADDLCKEMEEEIEQVLGRLAKEACQLSIGDKYKTDLWLWDQDWSRKGLKVRADAKKVKSVVSLSGKNDTLVDLKYKFFDLLQTSDSMFKIQPRSPGYPKWFQDLCSKNGEVWSPSIVGLTSSKKIVPKLLRLSWMNYPLHRHDTEKWGFIVPNKDSNVPFDEAEDTRCFPSQKLLDLLESHSSGLVQDSSSIEADDVDMEPRDYSIKRDKKKWKKEKKQKNSAEEEGIVLPELPGCLFQRLPHKDGKEFNVGNPLAKDFSDKVKDGILTTQSGGLAEKVLMSGKIMSYWKSNKDRICNQMVIPTPSSFDVILPQLVPAGTLTRRAVERTWLTASNAKADRIGSELKTLVQAPQGYHLVGADVDSQELWIAAVLGDAHFAMEHGSTPLGWMTLQGSKAEGTDMHSMTAKTVGVSRDNAKILNYGRIYGAGMAFAKQLLQRFNPGLTDQAAKRLASQMYLQTKGDKLYVLNQLGALCYAGVLFEKSRSSKAPWEDFVGLTVNRQEMSHILKFSRKLDLMFDKVDDSNQGGWLAREEAEAIILQMGIDCSDKILLDTKEVFEILSQLGSSYGAAGNAGQTQWSEATSKVSSRSLWKGGTESHTFNRLEEIALSWNAKTPVLGCRITRALDSKVVGTTDYMPSRVNWVVQSSAVDYLHLLLVSMNWLMQKYEISGRFLISIHDEVRYMMRDEDCYRGALALQISNMLVRAMFCSRLGMSNLPESVAYFSSVDIDDVMRKDPDSECRTPSNPQGLLHGYGIHKGKALTIDDIMQVTGSSLVRPTE